MELQAVIVALKTIEKGFLPANLLDGIRRIDVYTDSMYVVENLTNALYTWPRNRWTTREGAPVLNADLWKELAREYKSVPDRLRLRVEIMWRKGHSSSNSHNRAADNLAKKSANQPTRNDTSTAGRAAQEEHAHDGPRQRADARPEADDPHHRG